MMGKFYSYILAIFQYSLMAIILYVNYKYLYMALPFTIFLIGLIIGVYAVFNNGLGNFNIISEIKDEAALVTHGLYRYIRHPMYLSVIIMMFAAVIYDLNITNITLYISLLLVVFLKAKREENLWLKNHPDYNEYIKHTKMFIPFLF